MPGELFFSRSLDIIYFVISTTYRGGAVHLNVLYFDSYRKKSVNAYWIGEDNMLLFVPL